MPLFSDTLRNTNTEAPCLNVNDLQVQGFGIFADTAARDALNVTIRTEGYLACMNDSDKVYIYTSSSTADVDWTNTANWQLTGVDSFTGLTDTPSSYPLGSSGQSVIVNGNEDGLEFGSPSGASFQAYLLTSAPSTRVVFASGFDATSGLIRVYGTSPSTVTLEDKAVGIVVGPNSGGETVDVIVSGLIEDATFFTPTGVAPTYGQALYAGFGGLLYTQPRSNESFAVGRILDFTLVSTGAVDDTYSATIFVFMPQLNAFYLDEVSYDDSTRVVIHDPTGPLNPGDILKYVSNAFSEPSVSRWDPAGGDTADQIAGLSADADQTATYHSMCTAGYVRYDISVINGTAPVSGDFIYSDATTPYQLTTDPTSGVKVGLVQAVYTAFGQPTYVYIDVRINGGGGATTGEKLDFTVRSSAYTGATGEHEGIDLKLGGAASVTVGLSYYWNGNWNASDAVLPASGDGLMAMATDTGVGVNMMQKGIIQLAANPTGAVAGSVLYFESGTPGTLTATAPSASGNIVRVAGHAIDAAGLVYFDPSEDWLEIV